MVTTDEPRTGTSDLKSMINAEVPALTAFRHDLHRHPELSFQEERTNRRVQEELRSLGIEFKSGLGRGTGVVAYLPATEAAGRNAKSVALRADMDALPILEQSKKPYASQTPGVMHACGHDGHTTILLGAARVLSKMRRPHPVTFVFQPAEEHEGGGKIMCQEGVLKGAAGAGVGPEVGKIFGLHGWPQMPLGTVGSRPGPLLAAVDDFVVKVHGTQAHGAYPQLGFDPILASAHVVTALQSIVSRNVSPLDAAVVTVGQIHGGTANNIIPETVTLVGTVRTLNDRVKELVRARFFDVVNSAARAVGCTAEIDYHDGYPVTRNDPALTETFFAIAERAIPAERVVRIDNPTMGGEDFSFYGRHVPACFFFLGLRPASAGDEYPNLHQPGFDFNDEATPLGVELFVRLATGA